MRLLLILALVFSALSLSAAGNLWTNQAGKVIEAELRGFDGRNVTLVRTNGSSLQLPLSALCKTDQYRVLSTNRLSVCPEFVHVAFRDATIPLQRFAKLPAERQTPHGRSQVAALACEIFDSRVRSRRSELTNDVVQAEVRLLRQRLLAGNPNP